MVILNDEFFRGDVSEFHQSDFLLVQLFDRVRIHIGLKKVDHVEQLRVIWVSPPLEDWEAIVEVETEAVDKVVDDENVVKGTASNDPQVLDVKAVFGLETRLPRENVAEVLVLFLDSGDDMPAVKLGRSCEQNQVEVL